VVPPDHAIPHRTNEEDRQLAPQSSRTPSVITSKAAINDHLKTGQRNRGQDMKLFYRGGGS
jgi:hypothetical protein